jgi:hypothetical protein
MPESALGRLHRSPPKSLSARWGVVLPVSLVQRALASLADAYDAEQLELPAGPAPHSYSPSTRTTAVSLSTRLGSISGSHSSGRCHLKPCTPIAGVHPTSVWPSRTAGCRTGFSVETSTSLQLPRGARPHVLAQEPLLQRHRSLTPFLSAPNWTVRKKVSPGRRACAPSQRSSREASAGGIPKAPTPADGLVASRTVGDPRQTGAKGAVRMGPLRHDDSTISPRWPSRAAASSSGRRPICGQAPLRSLDRRRARRTISAARSARPSGRLVHEAPVGTRQGSWLASRGLLEVRQ